MKLDTDDWYKFQSYLQTEIPKSADTGISSSSFNILLWLTITFIFMAIFQNLATVHWPTAGLISALFIGVIGYWFHSCNNIKKAFAPTESGTFLGEHQFLINEEGIASSGRGYELKHTWPAVQRVERRKGLIVVFTDAAYGYVFPESKLENPDELYHFITEQHRNQSNQH